MNGGEIPGLEKRNIFYSDKYGLDLRHNWRANRNAALRVQRLKRDANDPSAFIDG
jgi:hypothetical protein